MSANITYSFFKRFKPFGIGGTFSPISKTAAKRLIKVNSGKIKKDFRLPADTRIVEPNSLADIYISIS